MAVDSPARIAVLGAGPVGIEAALYARYLGYDVDLYERKRVGEHLLQWGHVRFRAPWSATRSPLGIAALRAQDPQWRSPDDSALLTGRELVAAYYGPLAQSDLLADSLRLGADALAISREGLQREDFRDDEARTAYPFRIDYRDDTGADLVANAEVVIDATGLLGQHRGLGPEGVPLPGERELADVIEYGVPDLLGSARQRFAGRHTLLVGGGCTAATNAEGLKMLAAESPGTQFSWVKPPASIAALHWQEATRSVSVELSGIEPKMQSVDVVIANVGFAPDVRIYAELQGECAAATASGPERLLRAEPDFYVLGAKSCGRLSRFSMIEGLRQIRDLFTIIGDRAELDLYASFPA
jgi:hypothetical protein